MISTLLEISKLDAGALRAEPQAFALTDLFGQLSQEFQVIAEQREITFKAKPRDAVVQTDPKLLRRVLQNFLSNALRYTEPKGRVLFAIRTFRSDVRIEVWDNGIGMNPDDLPSIFDEFKRLSEGIQTEKKGLGLGLSISKRICDLLGLSLRVQSKPGIGSCFSLTLPRSDMDPESLKKRQSQRGQACPRCDWRFLSDSGSISERGRVREKHDPIPGFDCTLNDKPSKSQIRFEIESPRPRPFFSVWMPSERRLNSSKIEGRSSGFIPMPLSQTSIRTSDRKVRIANRTRPLGSV